MDGDALMNIKIRMIKQPSEHMVGFWTKGKEYDAQIVDNDGVKMLKFIGDDEVDNMILALTEGILFEVV